MALSSRIKHVLQCICLFSWVFIFCYVSGGIRFGEDPVDHIDPWTSYGTLVTLVLMLVRLFALLASQRDTSSRTEQMMPQLQVQLGDALAELALLPAPAGDADDTFILI